MIKILIADDHSVVIRGIKQILSEEKDMEVLGEASNSDEVMKLLFEHDWDLLILDITMPGKSGLDALIEIKQRKPDLKVLILSMHPDEEIAIRALKTGASGYLNKESVPEELIRAIRKVCSGGRYLSESIAESIAYSSIDKDVYRSAHEVLSEREFQVMCLIASGNSLTQIANELLLSIKTVSTYRARIFEKLNLRSNVELSHYAIKHKIIPHP
ncbi:MAG: response regulator transcription factor [Chlorobi bacterium]|nr:response regulator transcription factor [Chlorobiota bacterium]MCI0715446.1 response regulator transcription factor [Chlorobiota bacterium]